MKPDKKNDKNILDKFTWKEVKFVCICGLLGTVILEDHTNSEKIMCKDCGQVVTITPVEKKK